MFVRHSADIGQTFYYINSWSDFFTNVTDDTILNFLKKKLMKLVKN